MTIQDKSLSNRYNYLMRFPAWRKRLGLAPTLYAGRLHTALALNLNNKKEVHSVAKRAKDKTLKRIIVIIGLIALQGPSSAHAVSYSVNHLKLYAHSRILDYKEFQCFNKIITKESRWSYTAKNGSHYGLGQMRSKYYRDLDPYRQIDASLHYIFTRYSSSCKALAFHEKKGFY
jgi:hypothetical protein